MNEELQLQREALRKINDADDVDIFDMDKVNDLNDPEAGIELFDFDDGKKDKMNDADSDLQTYRLSSARSNLESARSS